MVSHVRNDRTHVTFLLQSEEGERTRRKNTSGGVRSFSTTEFELFKVNCTKSARSVLEHEHEHEKEGKRTQMHVLGRVPFLRAQCSCSCATAKVRVFREIGLPYRTRARDTSTTISVPFPSLSCSCSMFAYEKNRTARTLRGSCSNRSQVVRGIFRARTITTFGDRFVLVLHNRTCGVKRNGRNLVDEHGLREMCSCAYLFHTTRAKRRACSSLVFVFVFMFILRKLHVFSEKVPFVQHEHKNVHLCSFSLFFRVHVRVQYGPRGLCAVHFEQFKPCSGERTNTSEGVLPSCSFSSFTLEEESDVGSVVSHVRNH